MQISRVIIIKATQNEQNLKMFTLRLSGVERSSKQRIKTGIFKHSQSIVISNFSHRLGYDSSIIIDFPNWFSCLKLKKRKINLIYPSTAYGKHCRKSNQFQQHSRELTSRKVQNVPSIENSKNLSHTKRTQWYCKRWGAQEKKPETNLTLWRQFSN